MELSEFFRKYRSAAVGFSGGVDSAYLLYKGLQLGANVRPYFINTQFQTEEEYAHAAAVAESMDSKLTVIELDVLKDKNIAENPKDRCYHCKKALFSALIERAKADGCETVADGTNASDDISDRPGFRALRELGVQSPLYECGITKQQIREELKAAGFEFWNRPSNACLATRIPAGTAITADRLNKVERAEKLLKEFGFSDFRVRIFSGAARIQLKPEQMDMAVTKRNEILTGLQPYFDGVLLDLAQR